jgi:hypothetical protein
MGGGGFISGFGVPLSWSLSSDEEEQLRFTNELLEGAAKDRLEKQNIEDINLDKRAEENVLKQRIIMLLKETNEWVTSREMANHLGSDKRNVVHILLGLIKDKLVVRIWNDEVVPLYMLRDVLEGHMEKNTASTFNGKLFHYTGSILSNLKVFTLDDKGNETGTVVRIDVETISEVKKFLREKIDIKMGACRDNPSPNSLGMYLHSVKKSPQLLSYILPLLEMEGYLEHYRADKAIYVRLVQKQL